MQDLTPLVLFPAWIGLQVKELELEMPFSAIGSGYADTEVDN